jgi:hypothetical protein
MQFPSWKIFLIVSAILLVLIACVYFIFLKGNFFNSEKVSTEAVSAKTNSADASTKNEKNILETEPVPQKLQNPPEIIKAVFVTGYSAGSKNYFNYLNSFLEKTEINAAVIDIKGSDGVVTYPKRIPNINFLINYLHEKDIYVIGRIVVFQDPVFATFRPDLAISGYNSSWMDPASKDVWDYNISLAKDALENHGFDEINFDYVRFPSDGNTKNIEYPVYNGNPPAGGSKAEIIKNFFEYVRKNLANQKISVDLFGQTTVNTDDMGVGQVIESAFLNFDFVCPMVYPSHYANGFAGFQNPAEHPYEIVKYSLDSAMARKNILVDNKAKIRPWLQDFNMGSYYTAEMVKQEIQATKDSLKENYAGFMLWNPRNIYTAESVLK